MSEKQQQPETCIMINNRPTSQRSVATWFRCDGTFDPYVITNLLLSLFWKNFWNRSTLANLRGKVDGLKRPVRRALSCWKMNSLEIWRMASRNCCNSITLRLILTKFDFVIGGTYQTGVMSTTCDSPTGAISDWLTESRFYVPHDS